MTYWHRGRCLSYGEGVTYWALADMVRMRARIAEDEEPRSALAKLAAVVEEHIADAEERRFVEPRLAHLLALDEESGGYEREDLFAAWRLFFERLTGVYPVVMLFEDMQWADASLLDFIEYLLEWGRNSPILVVTQARPELLERRPTWGAGHRNFSSIYLEPLSPEAMEQLLAGLVPGLPGSCGRRSSPGRRGSRSTRSRPCACCSTGARSSRRGRSTSRPARSSRSRFRRPCTP